MTDLFTESMTEAQLQDAIVEYAQLNGWMIYHTYDSRRSNPGFPDLVLVRPPEILFWELKSSKGRVSRHQQIWVDTLGACVDEPVVESDVIRPKDYGWVLERLRRST